MKSVDRVTAVYDCINKLDVTAAEKQNLRDFFAPVVEQEYKAGRTAVTPPYSGYQADVDHLYNMYLYSMTAVLGMDLLEQLFDTLEPIRVDQLMDGLSQANFSPELGFDLLGDPIDEANRILVC